MARWIVTPSLSSPVGKLARKLHGLARAHDRTIQARYTLRAMEELLDKTLLKPLSEYVLICYSSVFNSNDTSNGGLSHIHAEVVFGANETPERQFHKFLMDFRNLHVSHITNSTESGAVIFDDETCELSFAANRNVPHFCELFHPQKEGWTMLVRQVDILQRHIENETGVIDRKLQRLIKKNGRNFTKSLERYGDETIDGILDQFLELLGSRIRNPSDSPRIDQELADLAKHLLPQIGRLDVRRY